MVFNARWAEMRGFRPDEVPGHVDTWIEGVHPDDWPEVKKQLDACLRGETAGYEADMRVRTKSGQWLWIHDRGKVFARDEQGNPTRMVGTEVDITARRNAEAALRIAEAKSSGILSRSADAIISIDTDRRITMFNEAAQRIFGYSEAEAMGASLDMLIPERLRAGHRRSIERLLAGPEITQPMAPEGVPIWAAQERGGIPHRGHDIEAHRRGDDPRERRAARRHPAETPGVGATVPGRARPGAGDQPRLRTDPRAGRAARGVGAGRLLPRRHGGRERGILRLDVACRDPESQWLCDALRRGPPTGKPAALFNATFHRKEPTLIEQVTPEILSAWAQDEEELRTLRAVAPISVIAVPLVAREKLLGVLKLFSSTPTRKYTPADVRVAREVAHQAALAIDNARLYQAATHAIRERDDVLGMVAHDLRNPLSAIRMNAHLLRRRQGDAAPGSRSPADAIERAVPGWTA